MNVSFVHLHGSVSIHQASCLLSAAHSNATEISMALSFAGRNHLHAPSTVIISNCEMEKLLLLKLGESCISTDGCLPFLLLSLQKSWESSPQQIKAVNLQRQAAGATPLFLVFQACVMQLFLLMCFGRTSCEVLNGSLASRESDIDTRIWSMMAVNWKLWFSNEVQVYCRWSTTCKQPWKMWWITLKELCRSPTNSLVY